MVTSIDIVVGGDREDGWMYNEGGEAFYFSSCSYGKQSFMYM